MGSFNPHAVDFLRPMEGLRSGAFDRTLSGHAWTLRPLHEDQG